MGGPIVFRYPIDYSEERDGVLLEDTFLKDWCSPLIKEVHLASFKSFKELATEIAFVFHSSSRKRGKKPEMQYLGEASMFLVFYVAVWTYRLMCKHKVYPNKGKDDQGDEVSILTNVTWNKHVRWGQHMLVAATGFGFEHKDIMFACRWLPKLPFPDECRDTSCLSEADRKRKGGRLHSEDQHQWSGVGVLMLSSKDCCGTLVVLFVVCVGFGSVCYVVRGSSYVDRVRRVLGHQQSISKNTQYI